MNCRSWPPVICPAITSCAPTQPTQAMLENAAKITTAVITARARVRRTAMSNELSTTRPNTRALVILMREGLHRLHRVAAFRWHARWCRRCGPGSCGSSVRTQRPNRISGISTTNTAPTTSAASFGLVTNIRMNAPVSITRLRSATETVEPTTVWISVVSAVRRDSTSPVRVTSKKAGVRPSTLANTALRISATTRSPIQVTK